MNQSSTRNINNNLMLIVIAAVANNFALGKDNKMLWHLPDDFRRFRELTTGHPIIMGRKTFESLPKMLPGRKHIIITRQQDFAAEDCITAHSLPDAIAQIPEGEDGYVIGGGEIYREAMPFTDKLEMTFVNAEFDADAFFPQIDDSKWQSVSEIAHGKDDRHAYPFVFRTYIRT